MAFHKDVINYSGRTVDLLLLQFIQAPVADKIVTPDVTNIPRMATGIEKMAQRFALVFLTQLGTVRHRETEGTKLLDAIGLGRVYDESTLRAEAESANRLTREQIRKEDITMDTPDDEALKSSSVIDLDLNRATATVFITISLTSEAGDTYTYITPISTGF